LSLEDNALRRATVGIAAGVIAMRRFAVIPVRFRAAYRWFASCVAVVCRNPTRLRPSISWDMKKLALLFALFAVLAGLAGSFLAVHYYNKSGWSNVGTALLALAVTFSVGGAAATWVRSVEQTRENRAAWRDLLRDVVEVDQTLEVARQLIAAHKTARTYSEQYAKIVDTRLTLRRVWLDPLVANDQHREGDVTIRSHLDRMKDYVESLGKEYEKSYLRVARQQRIDEEYLKRRVGDLASCREALENSAGRQGGATEVGGAVPLTDLGDGPAFRQQKPDGSDPVYSPTLAWKMLEERSQFPRLVEFLDDREYERCAFVKGFTGVKQILEKRAGIKRESALQPTILPTHADPPGR
jgi:hypothetical protein